MSMHHAEVGVSANVHYISEKYMVSLPYNDTVTFQVLSVTTNFIHLYNIWVKLPYTCT